MNWMTIAWSMVAAACLTLGMINLRVAIGQNHPTPYLFFFANSLAVASLAGLELGLLEATNLQQYESLLHWAQLPVWVMVVSILGVVWSLFRTGRTWLAVVAAGDNAS